MNAVADDLLAGYEGKDRELAVELLGIDPLLKRFVQLNQARLGYLNFQPRPDRPEMFDQQAGFVYNRDPVSFLVGGNAAGTTEGAAAKTALFLLYQQPPPRRNTPFWVLSNTYDQVCKVAWGEKLEGHGHLPPCEIDYDGIVWLDRRQNMPFSVPLKPWPGKPGANWVLEFKSYEQGRTAMQARSIGGFWFSEQFQLDVFLETLRGTREYMFAGGQFAEFTPIDPELCVWLEKVMEAPPKGWAFYRANTELNRGNLAEGWFDQFFALVPEELKETRLTGALAHFENIIYESFNPAIHVVDPDKIFFPQGCEHYRALDWGASEEHPFAAVWGYRDGKGDWWIYDEYWCPSQASITRDHACEILARSLAYGWPEPREWDNMKFKRMVWKRFKELRRAGVRRVKGYSTWGECYADPSRPGELAEFTELGIDTLPAANNVYEGINCVRTLLKPHPLTGKAKLHISRNCRQLTQEMRKYRWMRSRKPSEAALLNPKVARPIPLKRSDDLCDSLRYLLYTVERHRGMTPTSSSHRTYLERHGIQLDTAAVGGLASLYRLGPNGNGNGD